MEQRGMNERVQKLREKSVTTQPYIDMERAKIMTETYRECFPYRSCGDRR